MEQVVADPKLWPREVKLTQAVPLQLFTNGQPAGTVQGTVGLLLKVRAVEAGRLTVEFGNSVTVVAPAATDLLVRVNGSPAAAGASHETVKILNFREGWKMPRGKWTIAADGEITQTDTKDTTANAYTSIPQSGRLEYRLKQRYLAGKSACTTIFFMSDAGARLERGNSYLVADALDDKGVAEVSINKVTNDRPRSMKKFVVDPINGQWIDLRITYDAGTGVIEVTRNGKVVGSWTDPDPIKTGKDVSLGTCLTKAAFRDVQVRSWP